MSDFTLSISKRQRLLGNRTLGSAVLVGGSCIFAVHQTGIISPLMNILIILYYDVEIFHSSFFS